MSDKETKTGLSPFDFVNQIFNGKQDLMENQEVEKDYKPYLTNRSLSFHIDCILYAAEMNMNHHLDNKLQFHCLLNSIRQKKRYGKKWPKTTQSEDLTAIAEFYKINIHRAKEVIDIITPDHLVAIKQKLDKGGQ
jgi:hypothetical protein